MSDEIKLVGEYDDDMTAGAA